MQQVNYQETIVIPTLQKKLQELQSTNLVLEVTLMVEQAKLKDFQNYHQKIVSEQDSKILSTTELKNKMNAISDENAKNVRTVESLQQQLNSTSDELSRLKSNLSRESGVKDSVMGEYNVLKEEHTTLKNNYATLKNQLENEIATLKANLSREISVKESVMNEYNNIKNELESERAKVKKPVGRKKKEEEVMLDGETY